MIVCHLNIIGFRAAVAAAKDKSLRGRPYVIAAATRGRTLTQDCSPEAVRQGVTPGMTLAVAERRIKDLAIFPPDIPACETMNRELERIVARYAPLWENDGAGNLYLDITGTTRLFGPPADCGSRILQDILDQVEINPATALACNKLVSKVATRTIRPAGFIQVDAGTEAEFMAHQDIRILPGMGPGLLRTAAITGIREIGELAALTVSEALSIFGKHGSLLRSMAQGIDGSRVEERCEKRRITQRADFNEDTIDETVICGAIETLAEHGGLKMRNEKFGMKTLRLAVTYSDGVEAQGFEKTKRPLVTDSEIVTTAYAIYEKTVARRIRIRSLGLCFEELALLGYQPDLFEPETEIKNRNLQKAVDKIQNRYGVGKITKGLALAARSKPASMPILSLGVL